jgi:DNA-binding transcriptional ArsR family regulator
MPTGSGIAVKPTSFFEADWAEAKARLGRDPLVTELCRTPKQRRADAFVEMATLARCVPKGARRPEPLFTAVMGYEKFKWVCELANRTVVTPGSLVPYLTEALIERIVADGPSRVLDVGEARNFTGAARRAVEVLGQECFDETCEVPAEDAQIDNIVEASKGGPTRTWNGRPACGFHNRARNRGPQLDRQAGACLWCGAVTDVFKALADPTRRAILDELVERSDQTLFELCARLATKHGLASTRQAVSQHVDVLEAAGLVVTRREGRYKFHTIDTAPLAEVFQRWPVPKRKREPRAQDQPRQRPRRRPAAGAAVLHGGARLREEDRRPDG